ncbi:hypothetical protein NDN08_003437 [Rhodosorus marinus]|uniref:Non-structural maintenance of chromosomes element 1 homolog n=1 Tax=Rhodosorus marinus TaxID=101924 RepID=A0AAV8UY23_9RHOD|nr:hypothetical protein NDN08_003437 [Rhodosorus marinus]
MAMAAEDLSFLHEMIARKYESEEKVKNLYESLHENNPLQEGETIDHRIADMNRLLDFAHVELRKAAAPPDNKVYWGVVNSLDDELSKLMTKYSPEDVAIFFAIAKNILAEDSADADISFNDARNIGVEIADAENEENPRKASESKSQHLRLLQPQAVQESLSKLTSDGWLRIDLHSEQRRVSLGVRSFLELPEVREMFSRNLVANRPPEDNSSSDDTEQLARGAKRRRPNIIDSD